MRQLCAADLPTVLQQDLTMAEGADALHFARCCIETRASFGAFTDSGELVGFVLQAPYGEIRAYRVQKHHRRKGLSEVLTGNMVAILREKSAQQLIPFGSLVKTNKAALKLVEKVGCKLAPGSERVVVRFILPQPSSSDQQVSSKL